MKTLTIAFLTLALSASAWATPARTTGTQVDAGRADVTLPDTRPPIYPLPVRAPDPEPMQAPAHDQPRDENLYAAREAATPAEVQEFRGGGASIYIGGGAVTVALLIVLLIVLL